MRGTCRAHGDDPRNYTGLYFENHKGKFHLLCADIRRKDNTDVGRKYVERIQLSKIYGPVEGCCEHNRTKTLHYSAV
jgi:hypothetical protein